MGEKLRKEIKQSRPFGSVEAEAFLNILRTHETLMEGLVEVLKPARLSPTQYNVLRILRGAGAHACASGLSCREVASRMVTREPDMTRLLDRLQARELIMRERQAKDRRVIHVAITATGKALLEQVDPQVLDLHKRQLKRMTRAELASLIALLEKLRDSVQTSAPGRESHP